MQSVRYSRSFGTTRSPANRNSDCEWRHFQADELCGSTVTILGLSSIGQAIATRLDPTGVRTIGVRYTLEKGGPTDEVIGLEGAALHTALSRTDHHIPLPVRSPTSRAR